MNINVDKEICVISAYAYIVDHVNYGSILQYYALQKVLEHNGYNPFWLRFRFHKKNNLKQSVKKALKVVIRPKNTYLKNKTQKSFETFINKLLKVSDRLYYCEEELERDCPEAFAYITGSDQVWGGTLKPNYLCFVPDNKKKLSYAASFGRSTIDEEQFNTVAPWIKRLDVVSVRESSGKDICASMSIDAELVLDPTLLINREQYPADIAYAQRKGKYVFGYFLNLYSQNQLPVGSIEKYCDKHDLRFIVTGGVQGAENLPAKNIGYFSPEQWLGMYSQAEVILTNTFHGTVFALIYQKPFIVFLQDGATSKQNERIYSLLKMFHLESRIYDSSNSLECQINHQINWEQINECLADKRKESVRFLLESLK